MKQEPFDPPSKRTVVIMTASWQGQEKGTDLLSDETLVQLAKGGEHAAYIELSKRHSAKIRRMLVRITKNPEDAEDAMQETLLKAFAHLKTFDGRSSFSTWLTSIAINSALMTLRKKRRYSEVSLDTAPENENESYMQVADVSPSPESLYIQHERQVRLRRAIQRLPPRLRECIEVQQSGNATVQEVANLMGLSIAATKSRLLRARRIVVASLAAQFQIRVVQS